MSHVARQLLRESLEPSYNDPKLDDERLSVEHLHQMLNDVMHRIAATNANQHHLAQERALGINDPEVLSDGMKAQIVDGELQAAPARSSIGRRLVKKMRRKR